MHIIRNIKKQLRRLQDVIIVKELKWLNDFLADKYCEHCKESETVCLKLLSTRPKDKKNSKKSWYQRRKSKEVKELINSSKCMC